jgi:hypothetical protein
MSAMSKGVRKRFERILACPDTIEVDEEKIQRSVVAGQTIYLTGAQGSSFFL